jgi:hypothetical protein
MQKLFIVIIILIFTKSFSQNKNFIDQPFLETEVEIDSLIIPDRIYITITLNESDSKNKKSTEDLETSMNTVFKNLKIDTESDLSLLDFSSDFKKYFLKSQNVIKTKMFSLLVRDAMTAGTVIAELEKVDISNVTIDRTEYSKSNELILDLKTKAILKAKKNAESMTKPLNQKIGKAIHISDLNSISYELQGKAVGIKIRSASNIYGNKSIEPFIIEFNKIKYSTKVNVKFIIE